MAFPSRSLIASLPLIALLSIAAADVFAANEAAAQIEEEKIPVQLKAASAPTQSEENSSKLFMTLAALVVLGAGSLYGIKRYSIRNGKGVQNKIKVLTQYHLGPRKSLVIVQVAGESILVGVTDQNINHIKTLSLLDDELPAIDSKSFDQVAVESDLGNADGSSVKFDIKDEFKIAGLKQLGRGIK